MKQTWSLEAVAYLRANYADRHNADLGRSLGCTDVAIMGAARRYGAKKSSAYLSTLQRGRRTAFKRPLFIAACADLIARPTGACKGEMVRQTGVHPKNAHGFLYKALRAGELFSTGKLSQMRYFPTPEAAATGAVLLTAALAARRGVMIQRKRARERANYIPRPPRPVKVKVATPPRVKKVAVPKLPKLPKPLKPARVAVVVQRGPAYRDQPADMSRAKITRIPTPVFWYEVPSNYYGIFSAAGIGRDVQTGNAW